MHQHPFTWCASAPGYTSAWGDLHGDATQAYAVVATLDAAPSVDGAGQGGCVQRSGRATAE